MHLSYGLLILKLQQVIKEYEHEYSTHLIYPTLVFWNELLVN